MDEVWEAARDDTLRRDGFQCVAHMRGVAPWVRCGFGLHVHHVLPRGRGGRHELDNLVSLCGRHHDWVHSHPAEAREHDLYR